MVQTLIDILTTRILELPIPGYEFIVILDTYREPATKHSEHKRRTQIAPSPDMVVKLHTPIPKRETAIPYQ
jgi:hypothetical protein